MSFSPLSSKEIDTFRKFMEQNGWRDKGLPENNFIYSMREDRVITLTVKVPIRLPLRLNIPFEIASFKISLAFKVWSLSPTIYKKITILIKLIRKFTLEISIDQTIPVKGREKDILKFLNLIIPENINDELEKAWLNRIRISLMNKREQGSLKSLTDDQIKEIVSLIKKLGLKPTFSQPWELKQGVPKIKTTETLFFSNDEPFDEFFILEKGYITYFKDLDYHKFYLRTFIESYAVYFLNSVYADLPELAINEFIEQWVKFARILLNSMLDMINQIPFDEKDLVSFNPEYVLQKEEDNYKTNNFHFTALRYESALSKDLYPLHHELLSKPPDNFEVIEQVNFYTEAEELINYYRFDDATKLLTDALKIFNKHHQKGVVVSILLLLTKIALMLKKEGVAINYLKSALGVSKSGTVPLKFIIEIHYKLGKTYYSLNEYAASLEHFNILQNILNSPTLQEDKSLEGKEFDEKYYLGMCFLYKGMISLETDKHGEAKSFLKQSYQLSNDNYRMKLKYSLLRALYFKNKGNLSQTKKLLKSGLSAVKSFEIDATEKKNRAVILDLALELTEFYIHHRKDSKNANHLINQSRQLIDLKTIPGLRRALRWNLLTADFFKNFANNNKKYQHHLQEARKIRARLNDIGLSV